MTADYNKMEQIIADQAPIAPIYQYTNGRLIKPWVKAIRSPTLKTWPTARRCISSNTESIYLSPRLMRGFIIDDATKKVINFPRDKPRLIINRVAIIT